MSDVIISQDEREALFTTRLRLLNLPAERIVGAQTAPATALRLQLSGEPATVRESVLAFLRAVNELCDGVQRKQSRGVNVSAVQAAQDGFGVLMDRLRLSDQDPATWLRALRDTRAAERKLDVAAIDATISARSAARSAKDFETADRLQRELLAQGVVLLDHAQGSEWTLSTAT